MSTLRVILVDDEATSLRSLKYELETYCDNVEVLETYQDPVKAISGIENENQMSYFSILKCPY